jgi:methylated-DNA-protein-cysteine methyltransferase-like protein
VKTKAVKAKKEEPIRVSMFAEMLRQVRRVPRGKVATYGDIAYAAGYPGAARQVAWALHGEGRGGAKLGVASPAQGLPWHRIVGAGGTILLTGEHGFEQRMHLQAEGVGFLGLKVNMAAHQHSFFAKAGEKSARKASKNAGGMDAERKSTEAKVGRERRK